MLDLPYNFGAEETLYPELWDGCVGAWSPSFSGPTGSSLFDWSGRNIHGVLTNFTLSSAWNPLHAGGYSLLSDGTNDYVSFGTTLSSLTENFTASLWIHSSSLALSDCLFGTYNSSSGAVGWAFRCNGGADDIGISTGSGAGFTNDTYSPVTNTNDSLWHFMAFVCDVGGTSGTMWYSRSEGAPPVPDPVNFGGHGITASTLNLVLAGTSVGPGITFLANARWDSIAIHNRALSDDDIYKLAMSRGVMYQPRDVHYLAYPKTSNFPEAFSLNFRRRSPLVRM